MIKQLLTLLLLLCGANAQDSAETGAVLDIEQHRKKIAQRDLPKMLAAIPKDMRLPKRVIAKGKNAFVAINAFVQKHKLPELSEDLQELSENLNNSKKVERQALLKAHSFFSKHTKLMDAVHSYSAHKNFISPVSSIEYLEIYSYVRNLARLRT